MWNGAAEALNASPAMISARPSTSSESFECPAAAILSKPTLAGRAVDERAAEEQRRRADRADDQVLEPRLERADEVDVDRAHDVERDREPLEAEEHRHQVRRPDEERHPGAGRREQRVVLGRRARSRQRSPYEIEHGDERRSRRSGSARPRPSGRGRSSRRRSRAPCGLWSATTIASTNAVTKPTPQTIAADELADALRHEHGDEQQQRRRPRVIASVGESANQSTCGVCDRHQHGGA